MLSQLKLAGQVEDFHNHGKLFATLALQSAQADQSGTGTTPDEVVGLLVQRSSFDLALSTAATLDVDMTPIFQSLSRRCVELSRLSEIAEYAYPCLHMSRYIASADTTVTYHLPHSFTLHHSHPAFAAHRLRWRSATYIPHLHDMIPPRRSSNTDKSSLILCSRSTRTQSQAGRCQDG